jgi:hypothetical protein
MSETLTGFRMASTHLERQLQSTLGQDATEDLVTWMDGVDNMRADIAEMRTEMQVGFARIDARFAQMETLIERRTAELMKWSFVFWIGSIASIALLAKLLP